MTGEFTVHWVPEHGRARKLVFEPRSDGEPRWVRTEFERRESQWREVGSELVTEAWVTSPDDTHPVTEGGESECR